jgi:D-glycero-alpha-D-manno-heptose 1-phosphate guanylyltransferase
MEVIILAGGSGTRLRGITNDLIPKPMVEVNGKPFLEYILSELSKYNVTSIVLSVGFKYEVIKNYFKDSYKDIPIKYSIENDLLGTGGAVKQALNYTNDDDVCVLNGDTLFKINFDEFYSKHVSKSSLLSIALKEMENFDRYGTVLVSDSAICSFKEKQFCESGLINGGIYCLNKKLTEYFPNKDKFSFEKELLESQYDKIEINYSINDDYFIDIGIPEDYLKAKSDLNY